MIERFEVDVLCIKHMTNFLEMFVHRDSILISEGVTRIEYSSE
jgi:hypothetical protein